MSNDRHVLWSIASPEPGQILTKNHVQNPVQAVLHAPVRPHDTGEGQSTEGDRAEIITCLTLDLSISLDLGFNAANHGEVREYRFARVMPVRRHPVDFMTDGMPAGFQPPSGQVHGLIRFEP